MKIFSIYSLLAWSTWSYNILASETFQTVEKLKNTSSSLTENHIQSIADFLTDKGLEELGQQISKSKQLNHNQICYHLCNQHSYNCILRARTDLLIDTKDQDIEKYHHNYLLHPNYIQSKISSKHDVEVTCLDCRNNSEGKLCHFCTRGFYDKNHIDRIKVINIAKGSTIYSKILSTPIDCVPCDCHPEGSESYVCQEMTDWEDGFIPSEHEEKLLSGKDNSKTFNKTKTWRPDNRKLEKDDPRNYFRATNEAYHPPNVKTETGSCACNPGYFNYQCDHCDTNLKYAAEVPQRNSWIFFSKNYTELQGKSWPICVDKCVDNEPCKPNDPAAICSDSGMCKCSKDKFGPFCEYDKDWNFLKAGSELIHMSQSLVCWLSLFLILCF